MERKITDRLINWYKGDNKKAILIMGARQVGKTFIIRDFLKEHTGSFVELNFIENIDAKEVFLKAKSSEDIILRLSLFINKPLVKGETVVFLDEVQECKEIVTAIKFLVDQGDYRFIMSGSLLGVELHDIKSVPVGYMDIIEMFPLDFEEFCVANKVSKEVLQHLRSCFENHSLVDELIHSKIMSLYNLYLIVGGMPAVVKKYLITNNIKEVASEQNSINTLYKKDISKYDHANKLYINEIYDLIPSELNNQNKRFIMKNLNENFRFARYENSFIWLKDAGVAIPTYCANEPTVPLILSKSRNLFKLFHSDVGLLAEMSMNNIQMKILKGEKDINFGSIYENAVAQELRSKGFSLFYFNSKKHGELDFVLEIDGKVVPLEIKSGKNYTSHSALQKIIDITDYNIETAYVFANANVMKQVGKILYMPIYMTMFLDNSGIEDYIYKIDLSEIV